MSDPSSGAPKVTKTIVDRSDDRERTASCSESRPGDRSSRATGRQAAGIARRAGPASTTTLAGISEAASGATRRLAHTPVSAASAIPMASPATSRRRRKGRANPCPTRVVIRTSRTPRTSRMTAGALTAGGARARTAVAGGGRRRRGGRGAAGAGAGGGVVGSGAGLTGAGVEVGTGAARTASGAGALLARGACGRRRGRGSGRRSGSAATGRSSTVREPVWGVATALCSVLEGPGAALVESSAIANATTNAAMTIASETVTAERLGPPCSPASTRVNRSDTAPGLGRSDRRTDPIASAQRRGGSRSSSIYRSCRPVSPDDRKARAGTQRSLESPQPDQRLVGGAARESLLSTAHAAAPDVDRHGARHADGEQGYARAGRREQPAYPHDGERVEQGRRQRGLQAGGRGCRGRRRRVTRRRRGARRRRGRGRRGWSGLDDGRVLAGVVQGGSLVFVTLSSTQSFEPMSAAAATYVSDVAPAIGEHWSSSVAEQPAATASSPSARGCRSRWP